MYAIFAQGFWSSVLLRALAGVALAGTYMPGLSVITARLPPASRGRATPYYTASFSLGNAASYLLAARFSDADSWRLAFGASAACACAAASLVALLVPPLSPQPSASFKLRQLFAYKQVFANKPAVGYILAYGGHAWELLAFRQWLVPFLVFKRVSPAAASTVAFCVMSAGAVASIAGGELAHAASMGGRRRVLFKLLLLCAAVAAAVAASSLPQVPHWAAVIAIVAYGVTTISDSGVVTAGTVSHASAERHGITLSLHSMFGFVCPSVGTAAAGAVLQAAGGKDQAAAWAAAWCVVAAGGLMSLAALKVMGCRQECCGSLQHAAISVELASVRLPAAEEEVEEEEEEEALGESDKSIMLPQRSRSDCSVAFPGEGRE
jgi:MFS family permease